MVNHEVAAQAQSSQHFPGPRNPASFLSVREEISRPSGSRTTATEPAGWSSWVRPWAARSRAEGGIWLSRGEHTAMLPLNSEHFTGPAPPGCAASGDSPFPAPPAERGVPGPGERLCQARRSPGPAPREDALYPPPRRRSETTPGRVQGL
ncbi:unnamed protein product [Rangifer tarandus platyrhynchus]|uniref:Uncharacterized protein n=1 Tax=Rangifer tarandus platyrhynchus TaxID=3082113 RepID=A0ABN8Y015_RANTA|nr:unnamed protein product [Rangifer tarandus platyrhynchus]